MNVPCAGAIVREMVRLARRGGGVASYEADYLPHLCDPPFQAWVRPFEVFQRYASSNGSISLSVAETHRLFREAGLVDIEVSR